jgi:hypothetical protein
MSPQPTVSSCATTDVTDAIEARVVALEDAAAGVWSSVEVRDSVVGKLQALGLTEQEALALVGGV